MKKRKLTLDELKVESFTTSLDVSESQKLYGGGGASVMQTGDSPLPCTSQGCDGGGDGPPPPENPSTVSCNTTTDCPAPTPSPTPDPTPAPPPVIVFPRPPIGTPIPRRPQ